ncbi:hypothetical protein AB6A40_000361 [Gnathostoma spinigerum]|uniref:BZIP domain-containing protein n=1 Tax=Gnathostoma spinigerum TaxID=75299 RepID=A0ABD6EAE9_9BILA
MDLYDSAAMSRIPQQDDKSQRMDQNYDATEYCRQDSLTLCRELQEQDPCDFMDENMDLTPYLEGIHAEDLNTREEFEPFLDKQRLIEDDIHLQRDLQYTDLGSRSNVSTEPKTSELRMTTDTRHKSVKEETSWDDESVPNEEQTPSTSSRRDSDHEVLSFTPTIKPRRYMLKTEEEKKNPEYRLKRERNNDAVRKSRSKAKEQQRQKDQMIKDLTKKVSELKALLAEKDLQIAKQSAEIMKLRESFESHVDVSPALSGRNIIVKEEEKRDSVRRSGRRTLAK